MNTLYVVVPCYNESQVIRETTRRLREKISELINKAVISENSKILFVDDGSKDDTWEIINKLHNEDNCILGIKLSCNKGHQNALLAGLMTAREYADIVISMDADLQDDINATDKFIEKYEEGCDIVYGVRSSREKDTFFKRKTAESFYKFMNILGVNVIYNHADYRLMSKRALYDLGEFQEVNLFLRGLMPLIGYKTGTVEYERNERFAGESKYPLKKMLQFAFEGITSFSIKPIRLITSLGFIIFVMSLIMLIYFIVRHYTSNTVSGWTSTIVSIWVIGGLQLLAIGIIGEYIGKTYKETKKRPKYFIDKFLK